MSGQGGGGLSCKMGGDAHHLSKGCKLQIMVSLRMLGRFLHAAVKISFKVARKHTNGSYFSVCVRMISFRGQKSLSHTHIGPL